ncbi:hypothetical protein PAECIP112173_02915 [Paenibacillus sp. JJ-100]|uniref:hypothetical protein n=1 Tax=Paenibacillus sp. JJ-100 TaxID=2974896 RepID=UPI0022FF51FE|nr:hypothetical protein [Paenibacillus sp. JJ-100]CAI6080523.1 hypothetical protein PAECIP112173_02915 [Paenibacillus sp. JJ-100]
MKEEDVRKLSSLQESPSDKLDNKLSSGRPGSKTKLVAFSLMLAVPAVLAGCGSSDECDPNYDNGCEYDSSSGHYYYGGSSYRGSKDGSSSYKSSSKSKSSGFGSFFRSSGG